MVLAKKLLLLDRESDKSYGFFVPYVDKETGRITGAQGVYWFPKSLTTIEPTDKKFFKTEAFMVTAPQWLFNGQNLINYEIVEMPRGGSE